MAQKKKLPLIISEGGRRCLRCRRSLNYCQRYLLTRSNADRDVVDRRSGSMKSYRNEKSEKIKKTQIKKESCLPAAAAYLTARAKQRSFFVVLGIRHRGDCSHLIALEPRRWGFVKATAGSELLGRTARGKDQRNANFFCTELFTVQNSTLFARWQLIEKHMRSRPREAFNF